MNGANRARGSRAQGPELMAALRGGRVLSLPRCRLCALAQKAKNPLKTTPSLAFPFELFCLFTKRFTVREMRLWAQLDEPDRERKASIHLWLEFYSSAASLLILEEPTNTKHVERQQHHCKKPR